MSETFAAIAKAAESFAALDASARQVRKGLKGFAQVMRRLSRSGRRPARGLRIHARRLKAAKRRVG